MRQRRERPPAKIFLSFLAVVVCATVLMRDCWAAADEHDPGLADPQRFRSPTELFRDFLNSLSQHDGRRALALVDQSILEMYDVCRTRALSETVEELKARPVHYCVLDDVFSLRLYFTVEELQKRSPKQIFSDVVEKGLVIDPWLAASLPINVQKMMVADQGETSEAVYDTYIGQHKVPGAFSGFRWQEGEWRVNWRTLYSLKVVDREAFMWLTPANDEEAAALRLRRARFVLATKWYHQPFQIDRDGVSLEDDHVREYFDVFLGRPFDPIYLQPMSTWSLQQQRR